MDRIRWLAERRATVERENTAQGPTYDQYDPATPMHRRFVSRLMDQCQRRLILDAACGTAPYAGMVTAAGLGYVGVDQSDGMLTGRGRSGPKPDSTASVCKSSPFEGS